jgi:hypothetical protein
LQAAGLGASEAVALWHTTSSQHRHAACKEPGPSGDLRKCPPSALQMLAVGTATAALCALMAGIS